MLDAVRRRARSWGVKVLYFFIAVSFVIGFGILSSVRSCFKGGGAVVAVVEGDIISIRDFSRTFYKQLEALQKEKGQNLTKEEVEKLKRNVLGVLINRRLLVHYAMDLGIRVTDKEVANYIATRFNFFDANGRFDKRRYLMVLRQNRLYPDEFEKQVREDLFIQKLDEFLKTALEPTESELWLYYKRENEAVNLGFVEFDPHDYKKRVKVSEKELKLFYESHIENYKYGKRYVVKYLLFPWRKYAEKVKFSEDDLRRYFEEHYSRYKEAFENVVEKVRRDYTREKAMELAFNDVSKARAELDKGVDLKEIADEYGLKLQYTQPFEIPPKNEIPGIGDSQKFADNFRGLSEGAAAPVFEVDRGYILGVVDHILPEDIIPFEETKETVKENYVVEKAKELAKKSAEKFIEYARKRGIKRALRRWRKKADETGDFYIDAFSIPKIGISGELLTRAFTTPEKNKPFTSPFYVNGRYVVSWIKEKKLASRLDFEKNKEEYREKLLQFKLNLSRGILIFRLRQKSKIRIYSDAIEQLS